MISQRTFFTLLMLALIAAPVALTGQGADANPVPELLKNLESADGRIAAAAAISLGTIFRGRDEGSPDAKKAVGALKTKLAAQHPSRLRLEAAHALGQIQARSAVDALKAMVLDENATVSLSAAHAIGRILPDNEAAQLLKTVADANPPEAVLLTVYAAMAKVAGPADVDFLVKGMNNANWRIQVEAVRGLETAANRGARLSPETYTAIAGLLDNDVANIANQATHFLAHTRTTQALNTLIAAVETHGDGGPTDLSWRTRTHALQALHKIGMPRMSPALPAVIRQLGDRTTNVVNEVQRIFTSIRENERVPRGYLTPLLVTELEKSESLRLSSRIMAELGNKVPRQYASRTGVAASRILAASIKEPAQWEARTRAVILVGSCGRTADATVVAGCIGDDIANVRQAAGGAAQQLGKLVSADERAAVVKVLLPLLSNTGDWRKTAVAATASSAYPSNDLVTPLIRLLTHDVVNVQAASSRTLRNFAAGRDETIRSAVHTAIVPVIKANPSCWEYRAQVLGVMPPDSAVPLLITMLTDGEWRTKENAARAVRELAGHNSIRNEALNDVLIKNTQSNIRQVQESANDALRLLTPQGAAN
jgi:HEAT repeat protein